MAIPPPPVITRGKQEHPEATAFREYSLGRPGIIASLFATPHLRVAKGITAKIEKAELRKSASETSRPASAFSVSGATMGARPMQIDPERGTLACNKYDVLLPNRPTISVAVTLEDLKHESVAAWFGRSSRADHCGLIFVCGLDDGPAHPICWILRESTLLLIGQQADRSLTDELRQAIVKLLGVFFRDVRGLVPELSLLQPMIGMENPEELSP